MPLWRNARKVPKAELGSDSRHTVRSLASTPLTEGVMRAMNTNKKHVLFHSLLPIGFVLTFASSNFRVGSSKESPIDLISDDGEEDASATAERRHGSTAEATFQDRTAPVGLTHSHRAQFENTSPVNDEESGRIDDYVAATIAAFETSQNEGFDENGTASAPRKVDTEDQMARSSDQTGAQGYVLANLEFTNSTSKSEGANAATETDQSTHIIAAQGPGMTTLQAVGLQLPYPTSVTQTFGDFIIPTIACPQFMNNASSEESNSTRSTVKADDTGDDLDLLAQLTTGIVEDEDIPPSNDLAESEDSVIRSEDANPVETSLRAAGDAYSSESIGEVTEDVHSSKTPFEAVEAVHPSDSTDETLDGNYPSEPPIKNHQHQCIHSNETPIGTIEGIQPGKLTSETTEGDHSSESIREPSIVTAKGVHPSETPVNTHVETPIEPVVDVHPSQSSIETAESIYPGDSSTNPTVDSIAESQNTQMLDAASNGNDSMKRKRDGDDDTGADEEGQGPTKKAKELPISD